MRRQWLRSLAAAVAAPVVALTIPSAPAQADPGVLVYPGMEIHQGTNVCTLGFVDLAYAHGVHRRSLPRRGPVVDRDGKSIGTQTMFRDNTPDGATIATNHRSPTGRRSASRPTSRSTTSCPAGASSSPIPASCRRRACRSATSAWSRGRAAAPSRRSTTAGSRWPTASSARRAIPAVRSTRRPPTAGPRSSECSTARGAIPGRRVLADGQPAGREDVVSSASGTIG